MRKILILFFVAIIFSSLSAQEFGYPVEGEGWYSIKVRLPIEPKMEGGDWKIAEVQVNADRVRDYLLYRKGEEVFSKKLEGAGPYEIMVRYTWETEKVYEVRVYFMSKSGEKEICTAEPVKSPAKKGYWNSEWKNYLALRIAEENGEKRTHFPVHATVSVLSNYFSSSDEIRVVKTEKAGKDVSYAEIPCQVYDVVKWADEKLLSAEEKDEQTGKLITRYNPTTTFSLTFQVDLKPYEKATFLVFYNNPKAKKPSYETDLSVSGEGLAKTIENSFYKVVLQEKSGMVHEVYEKSTGIKMEHKLETNGSIHWNPDVYSPPHAWSHCSDWENPSFTEVVGPVFYSLRRDATLPHVKDAQVSTTYYFYANTPYILIESAMEIRKDLFVKALRNAEVVFNKEVFTEAAYKKMRGDVELIDFTNTKMHPEHVAILRPDTPWVCFFDQGKGVGFASLFLELTTGNIRGGQASTQQPYIYIQHGPWYYLSRAFVYSFGSNNQTRMLPVKEGSFYYEKNAWIPFAFKGKKGYARYLDTYYEMMKYPLKIEEVIETFAESPEGWLVPILTEPFEEGVEQAIGGKKKEEKGKK